jgi:hypothetical protein
MGSDDDDDTKSTTKVTIEDLKESLKKEKKRPCTRRPAPAFVHCWAWWIHLYVPLIVCYYIVRQVAAGNADVTTAVLVTVSLLMSILTCCTIGCCRMSICCGLWFGIAISVTLAAVTVMNDGESVAVDGVHNATKRVAIIGGGPSGTTAAWLLTRHNPSAKVDVFEASARNGGHSDTVMVDGPSGPQTLPIDIGFIFSTPDYTYYNALCDHFGVARVLSTISVLYHGDESRNLKKWSNVNGGAGALFRQEAGDARADKLEEDIRKFEQLASIPAANKSIIDLMIPLEAWLSWNGFGRDFFHSSLTPMLTPLFVTQNGNAAQSSGATTNHFQPDQGFLTFNASDPNQPPVFHSIGGVQFMYETMLDHVESQCAGCNIRKGHLVDAVGPSPGGWLVKATRASDGVQVEHEYDEVILACNGHIAARLLEAGDVPGGFASHWPSCTDARSGRAACTHGADGIWRGLRKWALANTEYEWADVTLTEAAVDDPVRTNDELYHIFAEGVMAGSIDRILDLAPSGTGGNYRLRVAPRPRDAAGRARVDQIAPDTNPILAQRRWEHHRFNLWEHLLVFRILRHVNNYDGLHVAGDWTESVGQNAAVRSGVRAACAVGMNAQQKQFMADVVGIDAGSVHGCGVGNSGSPGPGMRRMLERMRP